MGNFTDTEPDFDPTDRLKRERRLGRQLVKGFLWEDKGGLMSNYESMEWRIIKN